MRVAWCVRGVVRGACNAVVRACACVVGGACVRGAWCVGGACVVRWWCLRGVVRWWLLSACTLFNSKNAGSERSKTSS